MDIEDTAILVHHLGDDMTDIDPDTRIATTLGVSDMTKTTGMPEGTLLTTIVDTTLMNLHWAAGVEAAVMAMVEGIIRGCCDGTAA